MGWRTQAIIERRGNEVSDGADDGETENMVLIKPMRELMVESELMELARELIVEQITEQESDRPGGRGREDGELRHEREHERESERKSEKWVIKTE